MDGKIPGSLRRQLSVERVEEGIWDGAEWLLPLVAIMMRVGVADSADPAALKPDHRGVTLTIQAPLRLTLRPLSNRPVPIVMRRSPSTPPCLAHLHTRNASTLHLHPLLIFRSACERPCSFAIAVDVYLIAKLLHCDGVMYISTSSAMSQPHVLSYLGIRACSFLAD